MKTQNPSFVIAKRELKSYFSSPIAYIVTGLFVAASGILFFNTFFLANRAELRNFFSLLPITLSFFIPALTMRMFAEEKRSSSLETLMTLPVTAFDVTLGKYIAAFISGAILLLPSLFYVITCYIFGSPDLGPLAGGYLGSLFLIASFSAIGLYASSKTKNQIIAFFVAFAICIILTLLSQLAVFLPAVFVRPVTYLSSLSHFDSISRGIIDTRDLIYFVSLAGLFFVLTVRSLDKNGASQKNAVSFVEYIKSPESDTLLFVILLLLANLVFSNAYARFDLTGPKSYSLSKSSEQTVKTLEQPLSIKVFMTDNLPSPYNTIDQYIRDILVEYKGAANSNFSCEFFDMDKEENQKIARGYGISQVQIQELKNNEVGFKQVWMGIAVSYADRTEIIDGLNSADGLEYTLTTTINRMISTTSALSGLKGKVNLTLYATQKLADFNIAGFKNLESTVSAACKAVNKDNMDRIDFNSIDPAPEQIPELVQKYGIQSLNWNDPKTGKGIGALGLVLEYGDSFRLIPLQMTRTFFGQNIIAGTDNLEDELTENLKSLVSKPAVIGYITGHEELDLNDSKQGAGILNSLISDRYEFKSINLAETDIPSGLKSIVICGPKTKYSDEELYKIDQFVMRGGNLIVFADSFNEKLPQGQAMYYQAPTYDPIDSGLSKLLDKYGIKIGQDYVMDENCYVNKDQRSGSTPLYFAPLLQKTNMDRKNPITKNLGYVIMLQNSSIDVKGVDNIEGAKATVLAKSSPQSWLMQSNITTIPQLIRKPADKSVMKSENLAVVVEGRFESAFDKNPAQKDGSTGAFSFTDHHAKAIQNAKIFVVGSSKITTGQVMDDSGKQPIAMFVRNVIDYMNGEEDLCAMRTKGLSVNTLKAKSGITVNIAKYFNEFGLIVLVALAGLIAFVKIKAKQRMIRNKYNPDDAREIK